MARFDHGGGCACGLYKECNCDHSKPYSPSIDYKKKYEDLLKNISSALTPSSGNKSFHIGEYYIDREYITEDGEYYSEKILVPWDTVKEIMKKIKENIYDLD